jgi:alpha-tubulin suppressor-like RCC1 family protein
VPVWVEGSERFSQLTVHSLHTCGIASTALAYCWGADSFGQLGIGAAHWDGAPFPVAGDHRFGALAAGFQFTCGITLDGMPLCWGDNAVGQLGTPEPGERCISYEGGWASCSGSPVPVRGGLRLETVEAGSRHACGLTADGIAWCWGDNAAGQLGDGTTRSSSVPVRVVGGPFTALAAATRHTCALTPGGAAVCWGANDQGQLGTTAAGGDCGGYACSTVPIPVSGGLAFGTISAGGRHGAHTCAVGPEHVAYCWGANESGQLGLRVTSTGVFAPVVVSGQGVR